MNFSSIKNYITDNFDNMLICVTIAFLILEGGEDMMTILTLFLLLMQE